MRAAAVPGLEADGTVGVNLARVLAVRADEVRERLETALADGGDEPTHDLRIAVRRVRDLLERSGEALGAGREAGRLARELDGLHHALGLVRDCDVALPRLREHAAAIRTADRDVLLARARGGPRDAPPAAALAAGLPHAAEHRGVATLEAHLAARRASALAAVRDAWPQHRRDVLHAALLALARRAGAAQDRHGGADDGR